MPKFDIDEETDKLLRGERTLVKTKDKKGRPQKNYKKEAERLSQEIMENAKKKDPTISEATKQLAEAAGIENEPENKYVKYGKFGPYVLIDNVVSDLLQDYKFKTIYGKRGEDVWCYNENTGLWEMNGREIIKTQAEELLQNYSRIKAVNEIFEKIKRLTAVSRDEFFNKDISNLICVKNGVLNVETKELVSYNPDYNFRTKIDINYIPGTACPKLQKFIEETFYSQDIPVIQEWFGFHLYKKHFIKKAMILFGPKDTGKTIFLNCLICFVGEKNKTGISLHSISRGDKFTISFLKDKLGNVYDDLSFKDLSDAGGFKIATGGGYVTGEFKFGDTFEFLTYAKNTFATNKIPVIDGEQDEAYYLRWLPIPCDNEILKENQDNFLLEKLTTPEELSGLLNWALEGLHRLLKTGKFSYNKSVTEIRNLMEKHSNHLAAFTQDCLVEQKNGEITKDEMYELYSAYAKEYELQRLTKTQLGRNLEKFAKFISAKREQERYWSNVTINSNNKTLTTLLKNLRGNAKRKGILLRGLDMVLPEASKASKQDTYDAPKEKVLEEAKLSSKRL